MPPSHHVFGIPIEGESAEQALAKLDDPSNGSRWIVTANPEILLAARNEPGYAGVLRQADLRMVDGFGLWLMLRLVGQRTSRVTGVELAEAAIAMAAKNQWRVALVGGKADVASKAASELRRRFPALAITAEQGGTVDAAGQDDAAGEEARHRLTMFAPQVLLVAFGHPKQEKWIASHLKDFPSVKLAIGVGGAMDFWAGTAKRAPKAFRRAGLEWLWRLGAEPWRFRRIWNAVAVFPVMFVIDRFSR